MALFLSTFSHQGYLVCSLAFYVIAKVTELLDRQIYTHLQGWFSGHFMKHLLAGFGSLALLLMLKRRTVRERGSKDTASAG